MELTLKEGDKHFRKLRFITIHSSIISPNGDIQCVYSVPINNRFIHTSIVIKKEDVRTKVKMSESEWRQYITETSTK